MSMKIKRIGNSPSEELEAICKQFNTVLDLEKLPTDWLEKVEWALSKIQALTMLCINNSDMYKEYKACLEELNKWFIKWIYNLNEKEQN